MSESLYRVALDALVELSPEIEAARSGIKPKPTVPTLESIVSGFDPESEYRKNKIYLGTAEDGLPVSINLNNLGSGPRLVVSDKGAGNVDILKSIAQSIMMTHSPSSVQFVVITPNPNEWHIPEYSPHNPNGIIPVYEKSADDMILSLNAWAHSNRSNQSVVLLYEDLTRILSSNPETADHLRWLLMRGTSKHVFPIVTLDTSKAQEVSSWLPYFRSKIFGKITDPEEAGKFIESDKLTNANLDTLYQGSQFTVHTGNEWTRFLLPKI
ncbi:MAG: hypothetical protein HYV90_05390 [Candidatus Woesebacteria bacterium]|nr:MAG: hypothetical protein HYV90_05390 [Candidatus Woesebacteria bacterium]